MLEAALGARSRVMILRELVRRGHEGATGHELMRATGISSGTLAPSMKQLEALGLVHAKPGRRETRFFFVNAHALGPAVGQLFDAEAKFVNGISDYLREKFGSGIRYVGWAHAASDGSASIETIVLLVIADDAAKVRGRAAEVAASRRFLRVVAVSPDEARQALEQPASVVKRVLEQGLDVFVDPSWLDG